MTTTITTTTTRNCHRARNATRFGPMTLFRLLRPFDTPVPFTRERPFVIPVPLTRSCPLILLDLLTRPFPLICPTPFERPLLCGRIPGLIVVTFPFRSFRD